MQKLVAEIDTKYTPRGVTFFNLQPRCNHASVNELTYSNVCGSLYPRFPPQALLRSLAILYFAICGIMAAVTDHRFDIQKRQSKEPQRCLRTLTTEIASIRIALLPWHFNPARCHAVQEDDKEHRERLENLLTLECADLLLARATSQIPELAKAYEVVPIIQTWRPQYFLRMSSMCSFIVYLAVVVLIHEDALARRVSKPYRPNFARDIELTTLFLYQVGRYWAIATQLVRAARGWLTAISTEVTHKDAVRTL
ncbi:uncharacterized protein A1O9_04021 [Exophiala aquamarina CBS 119918]|uniref:Uncharacterized protein n=1 Tax=Exophiala aquamarina CBS 119918 TaxID=1182545 RepID=A0A072PHE9_9EURO|nr:uncharacterized protein A1O9_04021 [Exophiala aquamarina CBS 119918]KEF59177.1 hypothetical protein A1O9_04021 [Exophiala aquamarina CBS 119918]